MNEAELKQRTKVFALRILKLVESLPKRVAASVLAKQIARSGTSVGANYRSACRGRSKAEFASKIGICAEEADETVYWLELIAEAGLVPAQRLDDLQREANELAAIFIASSRTAQGRSKDT